MVQEEGYATPEVDCFEDCSQAAGACSILYCVYAEIANIVVPEELV